MPTRLAALASVLAAAFALWPLFALDVAWPGTVRDYLEAKGTVESGAMNLVSAIYLGYRAYDTLGETVVLLVAVTGAIGMMAAGSALAPREAGGAPVEPARSPRREARSRQRTELIAALSGKLGAVILIFGLYVMLYGHVSPGGGFQGGVVVASGIVFLALGSHGAAPSPLVGARNLARIESAGFAILLVAACLGVASGKGFLAPPLPGGDPVSFIIVLNAVIGIKVGAGIGLLCVAMLTEEAA